MAALRIRIGMLNPEHLHKYLDRLIECYKSDKVYKFLHLPDVGTEFFCRIIPLHVLKYGIAS